MLRKLLTQRPSHTTVAAYLALFIAVGGGSAYAINEYTGANIKDGTLTGKDVKNESLGAGKLAKNTLGSGRIADGSLAAVDLRPDVRTRTLAYRQSYADKTKRTVLRLGNLQISAYCAGSPGAETGLTLYVKNVGSQSGEMNAGLLLKNQSESQAFPHTHGATLGPGDEIDLYDDGNTAPDAPLVHTGSGRGLFSKAEVQLVLRTAGRVTTATFHEQATYIDNPGPDFDRKECNVDGTAVSGTS